MEHRRIAFRSRLNHILMPIQARVSRISSRFPSFHEIPVFISLLLEHLLRRTDFACSRTLDTPKRPIIIRRRDRRRINITYKATPLGRTIDIARRKRVFHFRYVQVTHQATDIIGSRCCRNRIAIHNTICITSLVQASNKPTDSIFPGYRTLRGTTSNRATALFADKAAHISYTRNIRPHKNTI